MSVGFRKKPVARRGQSLRSNLAVGGEKWLSSTTTLGVRNWPTLYKWKWSCSAGDAAAAAAMGGAFGVAEGDECFQGENA